MKRKVEEKFDSVAPWLYMAICLITVIVLVVVGSFIVHQQHQIKHTSRDIQQERIDSVVRACVDQNQRHDDAVNALYALLRKSGVKEARLQSAGANVVSLINALAPKHDCNAVVKKAVPSQTTTLQHVHPRPS
jgi:hypothetical protein